MTTSISEVEVGCDGRHADPARAGDRTKKAAGGLLSGPAASFRMTTLAASAGMPGGNASIVSRRRGRHAPNPGQWF